jgi:hypothetical protein
MSRLTNAEVEALLRNIDAINEKYSEKLPQLRSELGTIRITIEEAAKRGLWHDVADAALRLATVIKFLFDLLPPPG